MLSKLKLAKHHILAAARSTRQTESAMINQGRILCELHANKQSNELSDYEFKVFSQWGEDGIIQYLVRNIPNIKKQFIEFGIEDFFEANCRFLLMKDFWEGFVIDGSQDNLYSLRNSYYYWRHQLVDCCSFITKDNICDLLSKSNFDKDLGIISVDIDGIDYYVFEALSEWTPAIYIFEYNSLFGKDLPVTVPYDAAFTRNTAHYSNQYWGASLPAFHHLATLRGYSLVGTNTAGNNAFYVRNDLLNERIVAKSLESSFTSMSFRESRDEQGKLTFLSGSDRQALIADLPLVNVATGAKLFVRDL